MKAKRIMVLGSLLCLVPLLSYVTFAGSPTWPLSGGFHYTVDLHPTSFPANGVWDNQAQFAISDWRDMGATSFKSAYTRTASDPTNHGDGRNTWAWMNRPADTYLGVTFVRWSGATMTDCDIWFNSRPDYTWTTGLFDPTVDRPYWPVDFRNIARHECGHAIGFDHEDGTLDNMNTIAQHGAGVQHAAGSGQLPHADDKGGGRALYPLAGTVVNLMATRWREPAGGAGNNGPRWLDTTGTWAAGGVYPTQIWLENQSNTSVASGPAGVRVGIYLSTDAQISTADTLVGEYSFGNAWPAHTAGLYTLNASVPRTQPAGVYYVGGIFDNTNLVAEQFEADNIALLGKVLVTNTQRALAVASANPTTGVAITVSPLDTNGSGNGTTVFYRAYWDSEMVTLTAPSSYQGQPFRLWRLDGNAKARGNQTLVVTMDQNHNAVAEYTVRVPGSFASYGSGCKGGSGNFPFHIGNSSKGYPFVGERTDFDMGGAALNSAAALFVGQSSSQWGSFALPLDLTPYGVTGCKVEASLDAVIGVGTTALGTASVQILVPPNITLIGGVVWSQYAFLDPTAPRLVKVTLTNGLKSVIGGDL